MNDAATLDLQNLARDLQRAGEQAPAAIDQMFVGVAQQIMSYMVAKVPVRTGNLRDSITVQSFPGRTIIGPQGVEYAPFVEYGTGTKGEFPTQGWVIKPKTTDGVLVFKVSGKTVFTKEVHHPGSRPHPYARPAAQQYLDDIGAKAAQVGVDLIMGSAA